MQPPKSWHPGFAVQSAPESDSQGSGVPEQVPKTGGFGEFPLSGPSLTPGQWSQAATAETKPAKARRPERSRIFEMSGSHDAAGHDGDDLELDFARGTEDGDDVADPLFEERAPDG